MKTIEYYTSHRPDKQRIAELGKQGWQLCCVDENNDYIFSKEHIVDEPTKEIVILVGHHLKNHPKWEAIAAWDHMPTFDEIMAHENFELATQLDKDIASKLLLDNRVGVRYSEGFEDQYEYMFIYPKEGGDLALNDYCYTSNMNECNIINACNYSTLKNLEV